MAPAAFFSLIKAILAQICALRGGAGGGQRGQGTDYTQFWAHLGSPGLWVLTMGAVTLVLPFFGVLWTFLALFCLFWGYFHPGLGSGTLGALAFFLGGAFAFFGVLTLHSGCFISGFGVFSPWFG